ncbi:MAG: hypothetical protein HQK84_01510 [Nitrospinae bacterium]|nr:hypothetical protein [Nitrospinota bacterium]
MIVILNVIVGVFIGLYGDTFLTHVILPFFWGVIFCALTSVYRQDEFCKAMENAERNSLIKRFGMNPAQLFYLYEYLNALFISMIFSLVTGFVVVYLKYQL